MAIEMEEYLAPSFDPNSLTVANLRGILVAHSIAYPSSAKKTDLVGLFNEHVAPQGKKLLNVRARTKRSARGITDVPSTSTSVADEEEEPQTVSPKKRQSRRTTRVPVEDQDDIKPPWTSTSKKRSSSKHARTSDQGLEEERAARRTRHSTGTPRPRSVNYEQRQQADEESPFTTDNPFQSGSSPPAESRGGERRRKTLGHSEVKTKRQSTSSRRKTDNFTRVPQQDDGVRVPSRKTFDMPVAKLRQDPQELESDDAGEEFTPEEQADLALVQRQKPGAVDTRRKKKAGSSVGFVQNASLAFLLVILGGFATVWSQEKIKVGYCGAGEPATSLGGVEIPDWAEGVLPQCEPCPQHAICLQNLETHCDPDFVLSPHPFTLGGTIPLPLPPTCEPDSEKERKVKEVADAAVSHLRQRNADFECGTLVDEAGKSLPNSEINEQALKESLSAQRNKRLSQEQFDDLWASALPGIMNREEVVSNYDGTASQRTLKSNSLSRIPLKCALRRSLRQSVEQHIGKLVIICLILIAGFGGKREIADRRESETLAKDLSEKAIATLRQLAAYHAYDPANPEYVGVAHLRDDLMDLDAPPSMKKKVWDKVTKKVEGNTNVRSVVRDLKSGDVIRVWEWVGAASAIPDGKSSTITPKRSDPVLRLSFETRDMSSPANWHESKEMTHWDEGRPIY
ncbi:hypothetical protein K402DRAFT_378534 [Aulographum hederae CBS 113979]|uniref:LEM-like domain-containing protein n=1 Tax=Aulographum hederae CBS 113979 TaxID=1176131 RepID=A0A6G1GXU7_9PEZI|nr:hypothetical protein K402DRAFT_378534 [Aulographum hederae CBS 113979]